MADEETLSGEQISAAVEALENQVLEDPVVVPVEPDTQEAVEIPVQVEAVPAEVASESAEPTAATE